MLNLFIWIKQKLVTYHKDFLALSACPEEGRRC
jgi:hypothetical protein